MAIAYAPYIDNIIPAFGYETENSSIKLIIPFQDNLAVSQEMIIDYYIIIKDLNDNKIWSGGGGKKVNNKIVFTGSFQNKLITGTYYKVQMGYRDNKTEEPIAYSTIATTKYLGKLPTVSFSDDSNIYKKTIVYQNNDQECMETPYSCLLSLANGKTKELFFKKDSNGNIINSITILNFLNQNSTHYDTFIITTVNGYEIRLTGESLPSPSLTTTRTPNINYFPNEHNITKITISKSGSDDVLYLKEIDNGYELIPQNDYLIETGNQYKYAAIKKDCSAKISSSVTCKTVDYDSILLTSGKSKSKTGNIIEIKTLNIQYNPKINSFKNTIQEQKTDTIGGKYPIFYRNGNLGYKEFPISGLISYHMDDENFLDTSEFTDTSMNLTTQNIAAERKFRLKVLEWLANGEVKLFRSPTEGMYLVRLMNISLSPETKLGRMLYTFSCTAYEVAEINYENLVKYGFMDEIEGIDYVVG